MALKKNVSVLTIDLKTVLDTVGRAHLYQTLYRFSFILFFLISSVSGVHSQAWIRDKGGVYMQLGYNFIDGHRIYNNKGPVIQLPYRVQDYTYSAYIEYGLLPRFMFVSNVPYRSLRTYGKFHSDSPLNVTIDKGQLNAFGNIDLSMLYGIRQGKPLVVSTQIQYDLPTTEYRSSTGLRTGYDSDGIAAYINLGYSNMKMFSSLKLGVKVRGNNYSDQLVNRFEIGTLRKDKFYWIFGHEVLLSLHNSERDDGSSNQTGLYVNDTEYLAYSLKFGYKINPKLISWLYLSGGYWGNAVLQSPAIAISISYELKRETDNRTTTH